MAGNADAGGADAGAAMRALPSSETHPVLLLLVPHLLPPSSLQLVKDAQKRIVQLREAIFGDAESREKEKDDPSAASVRAEGVVLLARSVMEGEVLPLALTHLKTLDFESRKGVATVFNHVVRNDVAGFATSYMASHTALLYQMMDG